MEKIVALNSGGFDSIVMLHWLREQNPESFIHTLFFDYGQKTCKEERLCALNWSKNDIWSNVKEIGIDMPCDVKMTVEEQYIPDRNLIFLSYALSYAESIGATKIYMAITNPEKTEEERYFDTSNRFITMFNAVIEPLGIKVYTPFAQMSKYDLADYVWKYNLSREDFHSCNISSSTDGCGKCGDCEVIDQIYRTKRYMYPALHYLSNGIDNDLIEFMKNLRVTKAKLIINDNCQFHCKHCCMGEQDKITGKPLSVGEWDSVIKECVRYGINNFDLYGREVLFDDTVFHYLQTLSDLGVTNVNMVTNGLNVNKYIDKLIQYKPSVIISVETMETDTHIRTGTVKDDTFKILIENGIDVQASIDLSRENYKQLDKLIDHLYKIGVRDFYVKPITPYGDYAEEIYDSGMILNLGEVLDCIDVMNTFNRFTEYKGIRLAMMMKMYHTNQRKDFPERFNRLMYLYDTFKDCHVGNTLLDFEFFCVRFDDTITITPDGKVLGCGSEYVIKEPLSKGLIRESSLKDIISMEKDNLQNFYKEYGNKKGCYFFDEKFC